VLAITTVMPGHHRAHRPGDRRGHAHRPGTSNTITGFTAVAGTSGVTLGASVVPTIRNLLDAQGSLLAANASLDSAAWFLHPDRFTRLSKIREGAGGYMLMLSDAGIAEGTPRAPAPASGCWVSRCGSPPRSPAPRPAARSSWPT
jgi:hypothetical protein